MKCFCTESRQNSNQPSVMWRPTSSYGVVKHSTKRTTTYSRKLFGKEPP